jgi:hypothetical protein
MNETQNAPADSPAERTYTLKDVATAYAYGRSDGRHNPEFVVTSDFVAAALVQDVDYPLFTGFYNTVHALLATQPVPVEQLEERRERVIVSGDLFTNLHTMTGRNVTLTCTCDIGEDHSIFEETNGARNG